MTNPASHPDVPSVGPGAVGATPEQATAPEGGGGELAPAAAPTAPDALVDLVHRLEGATQLDRVAELVERVAQAVAPPGPRQDALMGRRLGHALHPLLTDLPLGAWTSASLLDLVGGRSSRSAATRLVAFGVASAVPTAASGLAEWLHAGEDARRVGVVHANLNAVALGLYAASLVARLRGRHGRAVALGVTGGLVATMGGYLGGHLSVARKVGSRDPRFAVSAG